MSNTEIVAAMKGHHSSLVAGLQERVDALADDVIAGRRHEASAAAVAEFLEGEIYPHAAAEEEAVYPLASHRAGAGLLVEAMVAEHLHLRRGAGDITTASDGVRSVAAAQAVATVFRLHADKENDFILPGLAADPTIDLAAVLSRMHALLEEPAATEEPGHDDVEGGLPIDVRSLPPAGRHALIFSTFEALRPGQSFELINDHDPKPLRYQIAAEHPRELTWDYIETGPTTWRVRIGRAAA
ncbi:MAG TPA: DUF2249 domain-containing protein [Acidimicrobiales bacterium]|nr:DUF2249 domain-containing protein [Acidimicrobiales bacterium]